MYKHPSVDPQSFRLTVFLLANQIILLTFACIFILDSIGLTTCLSVHLVHPSHQVAAAAIVADMVAMTVVVTVVVGVGKVLQHAHAC